MPFFRRRASLKAMAPCHDDASRHTFMTPPASATVTVLAALAVDQQSFDIAGPGGTVQSGAEACVASAFKLPGPGLREHGCH
eukprot:910842-Rhodomonas_salina.1